MTFYVSLFPDAEIMRIARYGAEGPGPEGSVFQAVFRIADQEVMCIDSHAHHEFTFTPSWSLYVECDSAEEVNRLGSALEVDGMALMPVGSYGFSERFAWVADRFGISWQLNYQGDVAPAP
ncbi:VOC family protein [Actinocorallia aurea]